MNSRGFHVYAALEASLGLEAIREALPVGTPLRAVVAGGGRTRRERDPAGRRPRHRRLLRGARAGARGDLGGDRPAGRPAGRGPLPRARRTGSSSGRSRPERTISSRCPSRRVSSASRFEKALARSRGAVASSSEGAMITVLGPKGGTGKTVTSSNLAVALALEGKSSVLVDLDLQFGDVGLALGLEPTRTIYDLATSGGTLDGDKIDRLPGPAPVRRAGAAGTAAAGSGGCDRHVLPARGVRDPPLAVRLRHRRHAAGLHARGDRGRRRVLASLHGGDARRALAQGHEDRPRDARPRWATTRGRSRSCSTAPTRAWASLSSTSSSCSAARRTCSSAATGRSPAH